mgnify:CR=1 FL=1
MVPGRLGIGGSVLAIRAAEVRVAALRGAVVLACATLMSCASTKPASVPPSSSSLPAPYDTKYEFRLVDETLKSRWADERMYWIDDDRLLFQADVYPVGVKIPQKDGSLVPPKRYGLYLWDERDRSLRQLEDTASGVCYTDGVLSYFARRGDQWLYLEGSFGAMKETPLASDAKAPPRVRCRAVPPGTIPARLIPLPGGGFLEDRRLAPGGALPHRYYPHVDAAPVELPINPVFLGTPRYSAYTRSHVFLSSHFDRATKTTAVLQVFIDGRTTTLKLTYGPWSNGVRVPLPTAKGWLLATALDGVYLMREGEIEKISPGQVRDTAVSPDGCRAALKMHFGSGSSFRPMPVYVVNLCGEGGRQ